MFIISQGKGVIVNLNNISSIYYGPCCTIKVQENSGGHVQLGYYKTPERLKEIFEEIIKAYIENPNGVYYLPKK